MCEEHNNINTHEIHSNLTNAVNAVHLIIKANPGIKQNLFLKKIFKNCL